MASQLFRNLDRLAGTAGNVLYGENVRQDQLLQSHLGRSQERYLQGQKQTEMRKLQQARLDSAQNLLNQRLGVADRQFKMREDRLNREHADKVSVDRETLAQQKARLLYSQDEKARENIKDQLNQYDDTMDSLVAQQRNLISQANMTGMTEDIDTQLKAITQKMRETELDKRIYAESYLPSYIQDKLNVGRKEKEIANQKRLQEEDRIFNKFINPPRYYNFGNATYKTNNTATEADDDFNLEDYAD